MLQSQNSAGRFCEQVIVSVSAVILGNAYVFLFFTCGQNPQLSQQALSAYAQSVRMKYVHSHLLHCAVISPSPSILPHV